MKQTQKKEEVIKYDIEIQVPEKLQEKIMKIEENKAKFIQESNQILNSLVEGFLSNSDIPEDSQIVYDPIKNIIGVKYK